MPVDAVGAGANPIVDNYTIGANAKAKEDAKTLATTKEMSQAEKEALFLKKMEQTSTMTNMEQMIQMTEASKKSFEAQQRAQGTTMVGKTAVYDAVDAQGNAVTTAGKIDAVEFLADGKVLAHIGKEKVEMSDILGIADPTENSPLDKAISDAVKEGKKPGAAAEPQKTPAAAGAAAAAETTPGQTGATPTPATQTNTQATNTPAPAA